MADNGTWKIQNPMRVSRSLLFPRKQVCRQVWWITCRISKSKGNRARSTWNQPFWLLRTRTSGSNLVTQSRNLAPVGSLPSEISRPAPVCFLSPELSHRVLFFRGPHLTCAGLRFHIPIGQRGSGNRQIREERNIPGSNSQHCRRGRWKRGWPLTRKLVCDKEVVESIVCFWSCFISWLQVSREDRFFLSLPISTQHASSWCWLGQCTGNDRKRKTLYVHHHNDSAFR